MLAAFVPAMRAAGWGRIVHVSSMMAHVTLPLHGAYNASKAALDALGTAARMELAPQGIAVVLIEPGPINSEFESVAVGDLDVEAAAGTPYERSMRDLAGVYKEFYAKGKPPTHTAQQIRRAIEERRPRARYADLGERVQHAADALAPVRIADRLKSRGVHL
jgi:NAD(P)-dependent dehydrogenase (short-subunit alcohol dehydrogenase family)